MDNRKVVLIGGFHEIIELLDLCDIEIEGIIDNKLQNEYLGKKVICKDEEIEQHIDYIRRFSLIITPDNPSVREKLHKYYSNFNLKFRNVISPKAMISKYAKIGDGSIIQSGVNLSSNSEIAGFVKLNTNANIMHDAYIGAFSTIAPNAVILGNVTIGKNVYIGANTTVLPGVTIGNNAIVGAGAVVTRNVQKDKIVKGIPAK